MTRIHYTYWLSTIESGDNGMGRDCWYLKDARREAKRLAQQLKTDVYINQQENIIECVPYTPDYKYFAVSESASEYYTTKKKMLADLRNFGDREIVRCYSLKGIEDVSDLEKEDCIGVYLNGKKMPDHYYFVDTIEEKAKIKGLIKQPGKYPEEISIAANGTLKELQQLVGGYIEIVNIPAGMTDIIAVIVNEEGKLLGLPDNVAITDYKGEIVDIIAGTVVVLGIDGEEFRSLSRHEQKYMTCYLDKRSL